MSWESEVVMLAGGRGSRMAELTEQTQKCLLPLEGRPVLGYVLENLVAAYGSVDLKIAVSYKAEDVMNFVDRNKSEKVRVTYVPHNLGGDSWGAYSSMDQIIHGPFVGIPGDVIVLPQVYQNVLDTYLGADTVDLVMTLSPKLDEVDTHALVKEQDKYVRGIQWPATSIPDSDAYRDVTIYGSDEKFFYYLDKYPNYGKAVISSFADALGAGDIKIGAYVTELPWIHFGYPADFNKKAI